MAVKLTLGIDIGVASVGFGLINPKTNEIHEKGVRIFSEGTADNNTIRRAHRSMRRLIRRKVARIYRVRRFLFENGLIKDIDFEPDANPYEIRARGLKDIINDGELATAILYYAKKSGYKYKLVDEETNTDEGKLIIANFVVNDQLERFKKDGKIRGDANKYHESLYRKELENILTKQGKNRSFIDECLKIIFQRRRYDEGPGSADSPTKFGRFLTLGAEPINLIEKMRGRCSIYPDELRAPKNSFTAELFNLLNDLNNLTHVKEGKITSEKKKEIIDYVKSKGKLTFKSILGIIGWKIDDIDGFRLDKKDEPIVTEFKVYTDIIKKYKSNGLEANRFVGEEDLFDKIIDILTATKIIEIREEELRKLNCLIDEEIKILARIKSISGYHSLSIKALKEINEEMLETKLNSMQIICKSNHTSADVSLSKKDIGEGITNPVVRKSILQTFRVVKAIVKKYGKDNIGKIVIELARESNNDEQKKKIRDYQKEKEKLKKEVIETCLNGDSTLYTDNLSLRYRLYKEQDGKSLYSGRPIDLNELMNDKQENHKFEIDHIVPLSLSFNDSYSNRALVYREENQIKGQRTPLMIIGTPEADKAKWWNRRDFEAFVRTNNHMERNKKSLLLFADDISRGVPRDSFINRNLNDTRYASTYILKALQNYFKKDNGDVLIKVINGKVTHIFRRKANLEKDRAFHCHHAIDALILAKLSEQKLVNSLMSEQPIFNQETGELLEDEQIFDHDTILFIKKLDSLDNIRDFTFSYQIDGKPNRKLSDEMIKSTRLIDGEQRVIKKFTSLYDEKSANGLRIAEWLRNADKPGKLQNEYKKLLIYQNDKPTFNHITKIIKTYSKEGINPLYLYAKDNGLLRKVSKNGNGPVIKSLRYIEDRLGTHKDISHKYITSKGLVVLLQLSPYRMDVFRNPDGEFKFLDIKYMDVSKKGSKYYIDKEYYLKRKAEAMIKDNANFICSLFRNDLVEFSYKDGEKEIIRFKVPNSEKRKIIEHSLFGKDNEKPQHLKTISSNIINIRKIGTDVLGKQFTISGAPLKLSWDEV